MQAAIGRREGATGRPPPRVLPPLADRRSAAMPAILALSLAAHVAVIASAALLAQPARPTPQGEVAVEVISEVPPETKPDAKGDGAKAAAADAERKAEDGRQEQAEPPTAKVEPPEPSKPSATEQAQAEQARAAEARAEQARAQQARADEAKAQAEAQSMRDELARLQAEQQALKAEAAKPAETPARAFAAGQSAGQPAGLGPLASSFQAVALPQESSDGDLVGYQAIVFSRLAKAKSMGRQLGIPGSAGVSFTVDERGTLTSVRLAVSSGIKALDEEALAIVREAAPFPAPPEGAQRSFEANVNFVVGE